MPFEKLRRNFRRLRQELLGRGFKSHPLNPGIIGVRGVDAGLEMMKEKKRNEWRAQGYSESLINKALELAQEWTYKMSEAFAPPEMREAAIRHNLPKGLEVADRWITAIGEAVKAT